MTNFWIFTGSESTDAAMYPIWACLPQESV